MVTKKIIGISVCLDRGRLIPRNADYFYVKRAYSGLVKSLGYIPILLSMDVDPVDAISICDGIIITGGEDIPAKLIQEEPHPSILEEYQERVEWDRTLIQACFEKRKKLLAICYGMQLANVHFGGTIYQDISSMVPNALPHKKEPSLEKHTIQTKKASLLNFILGDEFIVSSSHHQAIQKVADNLVATAWSKDGIIEAIESTNFIGVQWHPELDNTGKKILMSFFS